MRRRDTMIALAVFFAVPLVSQAVRAEVTLDASTGQLQVPEGAWSETFDEPQPHVTILELGAIPTDEAPVYEAGDALNGAGSMVLDDRFRAAEVGLPSADFSGRRVRASVWFRAEGTDLRASLVWTRGEGELLDLPFVPSGRATSDGWVEMTTGPVDFDVAGAGATSIRLEDRFDEVRGGMYQRHTDARVRVDALIIEDIGPGTTTDASCTVVSEEDVCGAGMCAFGRCVDKAIWRGRPPTSTEWREAIVERRLFQFRNLHAQRSADARLEDVAASLEGAEELDGMEFYSTLARAFEGARLDHFAPSRGGGLEAEAQALGLLNVPHRLPGQLCLVRGDADLLPEPIEAPLVASVDSAVSAFSQLERGDALVAVDGMDWRDWLALARFDSLACPNLSPGQESLAQSLLVWDAMLRGATLSFERCSIDADRACTPTEVETIEVDIAAEMWDAFWRGDGLSPVGSPCSPRFSDVTGDGPPWSEDRNGIRHLVINGMRAEADFLDRLTTGLSGDFDALIIDQRNGMGGRLSTASIVSAAVSTDSPVALTFLPRVALTDDVRAEIARCRDSSSVCDDFMQLHLPLSSDTPGPSADRALVVLNGAVYSANEMWMASLDARTAPTRIMGTAATHGSLGTPMELSALPGQVDGPTLVTRDSFVTRGDAIPAAPEWLSGNGWPLDEVCIQSQADAVLDVDTCVESAFEWLEGQR